MTELAISGVYSKKEETIHNDKYQTVCGQHRYLSESKRRAT